MRVLFSYLLLSLLPFAAAAQSQLPECLWFGQKHNCVGTLNYTDGKYVGEFKDGKPNGQGTTTNAIGGKYVGEYKDGKPHGQGTATNANGNKLVGEFKDNKANGQGTFTFANGDKYVGEFKDDKRHGQGTETSVKGNKLVGEIKDGKANGQGTFTFANGDKYVGEFKDDKRNGQGTYTYANGNTFVGEFKDNKRHGQGTFTFANGDKYVGEFKDDDSNDGIMTFVDGRKYVGKYMADRPNGQGTMTYPSGNKYIGEFKDDKRHGQGIEYTASGLIVSQGRWESDLLVQSFAINAQGLPFNSSLTVSATQAPAPDPVKAERDRLAADLEASRKKQQEMEEQLRVAQAAPAPNIRPAQSVQTERRVALVIGNAAYKVNPLKNPVNDSNDMARSLRAVGFDVIEANNTTLVAMREATRRFADKLANSDVGLVYYSGHGVEVKGKNYLIPVNADIKREYEVVDQAFDASQFLEMMDSIRGPNNKRVNILLVDACRNNELQRSWRSTNTGLARMDAPGGTFISFATAPGRVAADGVGRNSPYTKHLLQALKQPNMPIEQVFKVVRRNVMDETKGEQVPWDNSSLVGDFFFTVQK